jgi:predicted nucleic acid-binding protein
LIESSALNSRTPFWKKMRRGEMRADIAAEAESVVSFRKSLSYRNWPRQALELARETDDSLYDCCHLALALPRGVPMVTLDRALVAGAARSGRARVALHLADWIAE